MPDSTPLSDRYYQLIDEIVQATLQGKIRSKEQVYQMLLKGVSSGTGEIFDRCLDERFRATREQVDNPVSEIKQAKATRSLRALQTIQGEWERAQEQSRVSEAIATAVRAITTAQPTERLTALLRVLDPNQQQVLSLQQIAQLAKTLYSQARL